MRAVRAGAVALRSFVVLGLLVAPAAATEISIEGTTAGCFGAGCVVLEPSVSNATFDVTFGGVDPFALTTDETGFASGILLGVFDRGNANVSSALGPLSFTLGVTVTVPAGAGSTAIDGTIAGTNAGGGGPLGIAFDPGWHFVSFTNPQGSGSFQLSVLGVTGLAKNGSSNVYGAIREATFTPSGSAEAAIVPEPGTLLLVGAGLAAAAGRLRRAGIRRGRPSASAKY